jgi:hypothetical protein
MWIVYYSFLFARETHQLERWGEGTFTDYPSLTPGSVPVIMYGLLGYLLQEGVNIFKKAARFWITTIDHLSCS